MLPGSVGKLISNIRNELCSNILGCCRMVIHKSFKFKFLKDGACAGVLSVDWSNVKLPQPIRVELLLKCFHCRLIETGDKII